ncbi:MAG: LysR family transcriptional regulator [Coriobacteriales bacterium]|nr:LysR family transcriptional regulator [Coriobacteriales bacterium]
MLVDYYAYFLEFSKTLSISKTAQKYYMTPQGISRAIHALEKEFNLTLISREGNQASLTAAGKSLAQEAEHIIDAVLEAERKMTAIAMTQTRYSNAPVSLYITAFVSKYIIPLLNLQAPNLFSSEVRVQESNIFKILPRFSQLTSPNSFAMISIPEVPAFEQMLTEAIKEAGLEYQPLMRVPLCALVSISSPWAGYQPLSVTDIKDSPIVSYNDPVLFDALTQIIDRDNIVLTTSSTQALRQELEQNRAITFVPRIAQARDIPEATIIKPLIGAFSTRLGFLGIKGSLSETSIASVIDYIRNFFMENSDQLNLRDTYEIIDK